MTCAYNKHQGGGTKQEGIELNPLLTMALMEGGGENTAALTLMMSWRSRWTAVTVEYYK